MDALRRFVARNLMLKATALVLAILVWGYVNNQQTITRDFLIPINAVNVPDYVKTPVIFNHSRAQVWIRGPRERLADEGVNMERVVEIQVDLDSIPLVEGDNHWKIGPENVKFTFPFPQLRLEVDGNRVSPREATASIEFNTWNIDVVPPEIETPPGYKVAHLQVNPKRFLVAGPAAMVNRITEVRPQSLSIPLDEDQLPGKFTREIDLIFEDPKIRVVREVDGVRQIETKQIPKVTVSGEIEKD